MGLKTYCFVLIVYVIKQLLAFTIVLYKYTVNGCWFLHKYLDVYNVKGTLDFF